jgi:hypothetical protein
MLVVAIVVAVGATLFFAGAFAVELIVALIKGKPIKEYEPEGDDIEEEDE